MLLLLPYTFLVRIGSLLNPQSTTNDSLQNPVFQSILKMFPGAMAQSIAACIIVFLQACIIVVLFSRQRFSRENTLYSSVFYILFVSILPENNGLSEALIANTFFLLGIINIMEIFKINHPTVFLFNSGFFIGLSGIIHFPYLVYILFAIIAILSLRSFKILEILQLISGFLTPGFLMFTYMYLYDYPFNSGSYSITFFGWFSTPNTTLEVSSMIMMFVFGCAILFVLFNYNAITGKKMYQIQKKLDILYWCLAFSFLSVILFKTSLFAPVIIAAFPVSVLMGIILSENKNNWVSEGMHFVLFLSVLYSQLQGFLP